MLDLKAFRGKKIAVVGLGISGIDIVEAFRRSGIEPIVYDDKTYNKEDYNGWQWNEIDFLVLSAGIPHKFPSPHGAAALAIKHNVPIICDVDLLFFVQKDANFIGITGTNGKSTTTSLTAHVLAHNGYSVEMGGNIGRAVALCDNADTYVLELSSYQLERVPNISCNEAVILNLKPDHLVRHFDMSGYLEAKINIFNNIKNLAVISIDDSILKNYYDSHKPLMQNKLVGISVEKDFEGGIFCRNGILIDDFYYDNKEMIDLNQFSKLRGIHNKQNLLATYALLTSKGLSVSEIASGINSWTGLAHRQEVVRKIKDVTFVNDSKATNVDSVKYALQSWDNIYWILGNQYKNDDFSILKSFYGKIKKAYLIGEASDIFAKFLEGDVDFIKADTLDNAVSLAYKDSFEDTDNNKTILLSPAGASFDQFRSFEHRGEVFKDLVNKLR